MRMRVGGAIGLVHLADAGNLGGSLRRRVDALAGHQHMHLAQLQRRRDGTAGGLLDEAVLVVEQDKCGHRQITFASVCSLATSSATVSTFTPATRLGGSVTFRKVRRGAGIDAEIGGLHVSIGFLRAFMMFGSEA